MTAQLHGPEQISRPCQDFSARGSTGRPERASPSASVAPLVARLPAARVPVPSVVRSPEPVVGPDNDVGRPRSDLVRAPGARVGALGGLPGEPPNDPRAAHPRLPRLRRSPQRERSVLVTATAVAAGHDSSLANVAMHDAPRSCAPPLARTPRVTRQFVTARPSYPRESGGTPVRIAELPRDTPRPRTEGRSGAVVVRGDQ